MKFYQLIKNSAVFLSFAAGLLHGQIIMAATATSSTGECPGEKCGNAVLNESETPGAIAEKEGAIMADDVRKRGSDEDQWKSFILYSDSRNPKDLMISL